MRFLYGIDCGLTTFSCDKEVPGVVSCVQFLWLDQPGVLSFFLLLLTYYIQLWSQRRLWHICHISVSWYKQLMALFIWTVVSWTLSTLWYSHCLVYTEITKEHKLLIFTSHSQSFISATFSVCLSFSECLSLLQCLDTLINNIMELSLLIPCLNYCVCTLIAPTRHHDYLFNLNCR